MKVLFTALDAEAAGFLSEATAIDYTHVDFDRPDWFCVTALSDTDRLMGVAACEFKTWFDVHFTCAIADPRCMSRRLLRTIFSTLFSRAMRISALVDPGNQRAIGEVRRMGFQYEGYRRLGVEGRRDALEFGMLARECRWLMPVKANGGLHGIVSEAA